MGRTSSAGASLYSASRRLERSSCTAGLRGTGARPIDPLRLTGLGGRQAPLQERCQGPLGKPGSGQAKSASTNRLPRGWSLSNHRAFACPAQSDRRSTRQPVSDYPSTSAGKVSDSRSRSPISASGAKIQRVWLPAISMELQLAVESQMDRVVEEKVRSPKRESP